MEGPSKTSESQAILLIWKNRGENDAQRYELFKRLSVLFRKYDCNQLGISKGTLNNFISNSEGDSVMYENSNVRIVRTRMYTIGDFPPSDKEKKVNKEKVLKRKTR